MKDRLTALKASRQEGEDGEGHEMSTVRNGAANGGRAVASMSLQDFLSEISSLQTSISQLRSNIRTISTLHSRSFQLNFQDSKSEESNSLASTLDGSAADTRALMNSIKKRIQELTDATKSLAQNGMTQKADADSRMDHLNRIRSNFMEAIQEYQRVEQEFNAKSQDRVARQYKIVRPEATPEEIKEVVSGNSSGQQVFSEAILASSSRYSESRTAYREVQERQEEIKKIERTLAELAQLYQDLAFLVEQQDVPIAAAESTAIDVENNVSKGKEFTEQAVESARRARRMRIILFWIVVAVLVIVGLAVGLSIHFKN